MLLYFAEFAVHVSLTKQTVFNSTILLFAEHVVKRTLHCYAAASSKKSANHNQTPTPTP